MKSLNVYIFKSLGLNFTCRALVVRNTPRPCLFRQNKAKSIVQQGVDHELQTRGQCQNALSLVTQSKEMRVAEMSRVQCEIRVSQTADSH